ncbi:hypothetical protein ES319_D10G200600v1 [Gossypium barbadense]|uniref:Uncharacterized protein n=1 Tax=Gossypium barbadense TaxID=3634 RepID=A0A5J5PTM7_GOSBA|nr:hypothetical protein ES319_D10G200600v1 [Gossypium barbadense]
MGVINQFNFCKEKADMLIWTKVKDRPYTPKTLCSLVSSRENQRAKLWKLVWTKLAPRTWNSSFGYWCMVELLINLSYPREVPFLSTPISVPSVVNMRKLLINTARNMFHLDIQMAHPRDPKDFFLSWMFACVDHNYVGIERLAFLLQLDHYGC